MSLNWNTSELLVAIAVLVFTHALLFFTGFACGICVERRAGEVKHG